MDNEKFLVIAEKPSVAKLIASALGVGKKNVAKGLNCYEDEKYVITSASGHLVEYEKPKAKWKFEALPLNGPGNLIPKEIPTVKSKLNFIKKLLKRKDISSAINACDAGREGELIFNQIINYLNVNKPLYRVWLQSMTKKEIQKEFSNLRSSEEYKDLHSAALGRAIADWKIGMNGTRAVTAWANVAYGLNFSKQAVGRVKTPTLALVVSRDEEIEKFIPEKYSELYATFQTSSGEYNGTYIDKEFNNADFNEEEKRVRKSDRIFDIDKAEKIVSSCLNKKGVISEKSKENRQYSPALFDLTSLQREANSRFGFTASNTLKIAQSLYQPLSGEGYITYPRTDSRRLPDDYIQEIGKLLNNLGETKYKNYSKTILEENRVKADKRIFDSQAVSDHFAIIPTLNIPDLNKLREPQFKIYDLIVKRFLGIFYPPTITRETVRDTVIEGNLFRTSGKILIDKGWREVLDSNIEDKILNKIEENDPVEAIRIDRIDKDTTPKSRYTDSTLLRAMETAGKEIEDDELALIMKNKGIGTPATRAVIIEDLIERDKYLIRTEDENGKKCIASSIRGKKLIKDLKMLKIEQLTSASLTAEWESKLIEIEENKYSYEEFIREIENLRDEIIQRAKDTRVDTDEHIRPLGIDCPITGLPMYETFNRYTTDKPEESTNIGKVYSGRPISRDEAIELIRSYDGNVGTINLTGFVNRFGQVFDAPLQFTKDIPRCKFPEDYFSGSKEVNLEELELLCESPVVKSKVYYDEDFYYFGKAGKNKIARRILSPYLNSEDEEEKKKDSLPIDEAEKLFKDGKTSILQFKSKRKNARMPFFKAKLYLDSKFSPKWEMTQRKTKKTRKSVKSVQ